MREEAQPCPALPCPALPSLPSPALHCPTQPWVGEQGRELGRRGYGLRAGRHRGVGRDFLASPVLRRAPFYAGSTRRSHGICCWGCRDCSHALRRPRPSILSGARTISCASSQERTVRRLPLTPNGHFGRNTLKFVHQWTQIVADVCTESRKSRFCSRLWSTSS